MSSKQPVAAEYLNGGFYGGKAEDLEVALRLECTFCYFELARRGCDKRRDNLESELSAWQEATPPSRPFA